MAPHLRFDRAALHSGSVVHLFTLRLGDDSKDRVERHEQTTLAPSPKEPLLDLH